MYIVNLEYQIGEEIKTVSHVINECHVHVSAQNSSCRLLVPIEADIRVYEYIVEQKGKVVNIVLFDADEKQVYQSAEWPTVQHVANTFNADGVNREIALGR